MIDFGFRAQRLANKLWGRTPFVQNQVRHPALDRRQAAAQGAGDPLHQQADAGRAAEEDRARLLDIEDAATIPIIRDPAKMTEDSEAVFYFPGCGSERLFGQVGLATQALLYHVGSQCVLPPGYLCCGYPQTSAGRADKGEQITIQNRVLFHRVANTLNYLDIKTVVVSCGTCMDQLQKYEFDKIFPAAASSTSTST
jgi:Fe-S oxidoreductase